MGKSKKMRRRSKGLTFYHRRKKISSNTVKEILSWIFGVLVSVFLAFVVVYYLGMSTSVVGVSMEPELTTGQTVFVNKFSYIIFAPKRNDVIVFLPNGNENAHYYIKRVVAVPGDTVQIIDGKLYVNSEMITEEAYDKMSDAGIAANEITVGTDEFFVLGDNRNNSEDSRSANIGLVKRKDIVGEAWLHLGSEIDGIGFVE